MNLVTDVRPYTPAFELCSDGAVKRRFIWLPPGSVINTTDADDWLFPHGARLWKEFTRDGVRVETRLLLETGDGECDWAGAAYVWSGDDAVLTSKGMINALGTEHDVPAAERCLGCHGGRKSRVLGFSAVQLENSAGPLTLRDAEAAHLLSSSPNGSFKLPGSTADQKVGSKLFQLYTHRGGPNLWGPSQMPPLATKKVDDAGATLLGDWINAR